METYLEHIPRLSSHRREICMYNRPCQHFPRIKIVNEINTTVREFRSREGYSAQLRHRRNLQLDAQAAPLDLVIKEIVRPLPKTPNRNKVLFIIAKR